ncbi:two-component system phosphate regulon sensor histidine kinase PhoR [Breznakibacter xylanolyticus]|uniref:histidine kinase n=1 Tax=Breznakibacter xylanolyticus TaxID=990 RepID=A0A2W7NGT5_9BACT|nr:HAMP domain-containing sensor histidine kinase [Breznakibacter xylanolyticus]PZX19448.1 two-component system phosphate regulon sensor histidine kinase PhoR [Breznakibacter xylanolyticus]
MVLKRLLSSGTGRFSVVAVFTFAVLLLLVVIQVIWIHRAAMLEQKNFNYRVAKAMYCVREEIGKRAVDCHQMMDYLSGNSCPDKIKQSKVAEVDSIIRTNLEAHHIELQYEFMIGDSVTLSAMSLPKQVCYVQSLNGLIQKDGIRLNMRFPDRNEFIMAQMKGWFVISILFILFVAASFFITLRMFVRQQAQLTHTTDFINNMVHEFQTPLANMRLAAGLIRKKNDLPVSSKINDYLDVIVNENNKMEGNVKRILQLATLHREDQSLEPVSMHLVGDSVVQQFMFRVSNSNGSIETSWDAANDKVFGAWEHFELMLSNLIDNALKYSMGTPHIRLTSKVDNHFIEITVSDNGIGIDARELPFVFDRYYRVSTGNVHNVKGFGLGLAYVKKITELYHGSVEVSSRVGKGTTFTLKFPLVYV